MLLHQQVHYEHLQNHDQIMYYVILLNSAIYIYYNNVGILQKSVDERIVQIFGFLFRVMVDIFSEKLSSNNLFIKIYIMSNNKMCFFYIPSKLSQEPNLNHFHLQALF